MSPTEPIVSTRHDLVRSAVPPLVAALAVIAGSAMSWSVQTSHFDSVSLSGFNLGDGKITTICALVATAVIGAVTYFGLPPKPLTVIGSLAALTILGIGLYDTVNGLQNGQSDNALIGSQHVGVGLWLTDAGALVLSALMVVAAVRAFTGWPAFIDLIHHEATVTRQRRPRPRPWRSRSARYAGYRFSGSPPISRTSPTTRPPSERPQIWGGPLISAYRSCRRERTCSGVNDRRCRSRRATTTPVAATPASPASPATFHHRT